MIRLSKAQVLFLHEQLIAETGGAAGLLCILGRR